MTKELVGRELDKALALALGYRSFAWHPSERIVDAWQVVEVMMQRGFHARLKTPFESGQPFFAGFTPLGVSGWNGRPDHEGSGDSMPLAICRAALQAVSPANSTETKE